MKSNQKLVFSHRKVRVFVAGSALVLFIAIHLYLGASSIQNTKVSTFVGVFEIYFNSLLRLVFPILVTLLAATTLQSQLSSNFIAFTRSRQSLHSYFLASLRRAIMNNFMFFITLGTCTVIGVCCFELGAHPGLVDPKPFGLTNQEALLQVYTQNPLGWAASGGAVAYGMALTAWLVISSIVLTLFSFAVLLFTRHRAALLAPFAFYIVETLVFQLNSSPKYGLFASMPTPISMQSFSLFEAAIPLVTIAFISGLAIQFKIRAAKNSGEFS